MGCIDDDTVIREGLRVLLPTIHSTDAAHVRNGNGTGHGRERDGAVGSATRSDSWAGPDVRVEVVGTYSRVEDFLVQAPRVDVVLVDLEILDRSDVPVLNGMHGVAAVAAAGYLPVIYTNEQRPHVLAGCLAKGARGVVQKADPLEDLVAALVTVSSGGTVVTTSLAGLMEVFSRRGRTGPLSPRQGQVLSARARGETYKSIATRLYLSPKTVEGYMSDVTQQFADYLATHSEADLERQLGIGPGDLMSSPQDPR